MIGVAIIFAAIVVAAIAAHAAFAAFAAPAAAAAAASAAANQLVALDVAAESYYADHAATPPADLYARVGPYVTVVPSDPADQGHGADYTVETYASGDGWVIDDGYRHPASALRGLRRWDGTPGDTPHGTCDDDCTRLVYDSGVGVLGAP
ncbi:hypothetical protein EPN42_10150 [bacterium]|nr:MAG: hypothetical protein EPN42_10150 [bacterium]